MQIKFTYSKDKDIWCLLNKGKSSNNSQNPTKQYVELTTKFGDNPTENNTALFIDEYIKSNHIDIQKILIDFQTNWENISAEFHKRAEAIFGIKLQQDITVYTTINSRCPYSIQDNSFYVSLQSLCAPKTVIHELWHFYTWYGLGIDQEEKIGKQKYNDLKEALTVLLNIEFKYLLPEGVIDQGYPQHSELRQKIIQLWNVEKDIHIVWNNLAA